MQKHFPGEYLTFARKVSVCMVSFASFGCAPPILQQPPMEPRCAAFNLTAMTAASARPGYPPPHLLAASVITSRSLSRISALIWQENMPLQLELWYKFLMIAREQVSELRPRDAALCTENNLPCHCLLIF